MKFRASDTEVRLLIEEIEAGLTRQPGFLKNKFFDHYVRLIVKRKLEAPEGIIEKHHITPRSVGGQDTPSNLIDLTPREHFVAHRLLTKCTAGKTLRSMKLALSFFMTTCRNHKRVISSRQYQIAREAVRNKIGFFYFADNVYSYDADFYRFCDMQKIGRANLQAKMSTTQVAVITTGKHKGKAFSFLDVGEKRMREAIEEQMNKSKQKRAAAVSSQWQKQPKHNPRKRSVVLQDTNGKIWNFDSMGDVEAKTGIPWTTIQSCRKIPHTFKYGAASGWTLLDIDKSVKDICRN